MRSATAAAANLTERTARRHAEMDNPVANLIVAFS
jgi:hypothetical protein